MDAKKPVNPDRTRDELIVALDFYLAWKGNPPGKQSTEILDLSSFFNKLHQADRQSLNIGSHVTSGRNLNMGPFPGIDSAIVETVRRASNHARSKASAIMAQRLRIVST